MIDGGEEDAPPLPLSEARFLREREGMSVRGEVVQFHGADGRLFASVTTDLGGQAVGPMEAGGSVSFRSVSGTLVTIVGINPSETITYLEDPELREPLVDTLQLTLSGAFTNATYYDVTCGGRGFSEPAIATGQFGFGVARGCLDADSTIDLVATALDANGAPIAFSFLADRQLPSSGGSRSATFPAWRTDFAMLDRTVAGLPSTATQVGVSVVPSDSSTQSYIYARDQGTYAPVSAGRATVSRRVAPVTDRVLAWTQITHSFGDTTARQNLVQRDAFADIDGRTVNATELLPVVVNGSLILDEVRWSLDALPSSADAMMIELQRGSQSWRIFAPPDATSVRVPTLVGALATSPGLVSLQALVLTDDDSTTWDDRRLTPYVPDPLPAFEYRTSVLVF